MVSFIMETLNKAQCRAVTSEAATVAILAGPGSGKTHTLTSRVVWLVDSVGYRPEHIIVATFTVKSAREMKERIGKALGPERANKIILGTFHSVARRYIAAYGSRIGMGQKFGIADSNESRAMIDRICKRLQLAVDPAAARGWISKKKSKGGDAGHAPKRQTSDRMTGLQELETCYGEYQAQLERSNLLDYDDLLVRCVELLRKCPTCVSNVQTVLVDEYQDTNGIQYELMKLFAQRHKRITVVGDPDQSIYGWRSAEIQNLWRLLQEYPGTDEVSLEENYRSFQSILDLSLRVIQQDTKRYNKLLKPVHNKGTRPVLRRLRTAAKEADWIVSEIRRATMMSGDMMTFNDVAILLRSAALSRHVEGALGRAGMPYKMVGGSKFYDRKEIKIILNYLRVIYQPENNDALADILNVPRRGVGEGTTKNLVDEAEKSSLSLWTMLGKHFRGDRLAKTKIMKQAEQRLSGELFRLINNIRKKLDDIALGTPFGLVEMIEQLLASLGFQKFLQNTYPEDHEQRWANVQEFVGLAADFVRDMDRLGDDSLPDIEGLQQSTESEVLPRFLANVSLASDAQANGDGQEGTPLITISTIHAAKGLEWPIVFVPAVYDGSIPHMRSEDLDEERRLLYVAMTRAQALLYLSCPLYSSMEGGGTNQLSQFVTPLGNSLAKKGPCFDRPIMEAISRVLRRELPLEDAIFKALPQGFGPEDNLFPEDPEAQDRLNESTNSLSDGPRAKRPRLNPSGPPGSGADDRNWHREYKGNGYKTTMEEASNFTVAALPGFMSAGSHQVQLAAVAAAEAEAKKMAQNRNVPAKRSITRRPADQASIIGFVRSNPTAPARPGQLGQNELPNMRGAVETRFGAHQPRAEGDRSAIDPALSAHKLAGGKIAGRPLQPNRGDSSGPRNQYAVFSSSPPKPPTSDVPVESTDEGENEPPPSPRRVAGSLHATTMAMPKGLGGGFRRPTGLGRETIAPLERLRKPFKPLTMNRP